VNTLCAEIEDELSVGGVFLRLYNSQPGWTLREPRQFMIACFEKFVSLCSDRSTAATDQIQQLALAITNVLRVNTTMVDSVAALGMWPPACLFGRGPCPWRPMMYLFEYPVIAGSSFYFKINEEENHILVVVQSIVYHMLSRWAQGTYRRLSRC
jgi:hypothetical protein